jgi:HEAT repeat protein
LGKRVDSADYVALLLPLIEALQDDPSWRVRQQLAKSMPKMVESVDAEVAAKRLLPCFAKMLRDKESEVRVHACKSLSGVSAAVKNPQALQDHISGPLDALATDAVQNVRVAFSNSLVELCPYFPKETSAKLLIPLIQQLTKDEFHTVRNNIISKIDVLADVRTARNYMEYTERMND